MFRILWVLIIIIIPLYAYHPIILNGDLCRGWNGRRIFVDNNEIIVLSAKHLSQHENRSHCSVNFHACSFCHFQLRLTHLNMSSCGYRSGTLCSCSNLTIHEPPHEYSYFNLCDSYKRDRKLYTHTNEIQVALRALQDQQHAFTLRIRVRRNSFLFASNATCKRGLQEKDHVSSPFFPNYYPSTYTADYIFYNVGGTIRIVFQDFRIGAWSYFEVLERSNDRRRVYSGYSFRPPIIESQESEMKIRFIANGMSAMGYRFTYHFLNCTGSRVNYTEVPITDCGGVVTNLGGSIVMSHMSHREVRSYDCVWVIQPLVSNRYSSDISVRVDRFQYFGSNSTLTIHEGTTSISSQVLRLTGDMQVLPPVRNGTNSKVHKSREYIVPTSTGYYIRLKADLGPQSSLAIVYSLFTYDECFSIVDVRCNNSRCIAGDLRCDGFDQCGDGSDEPQGCYDEHRVIQWHASNYYFPKQINPDMYGSHVVILGCIFLVVLSPVLCGLLFWRITVKGREEYQRHRALELIRELERDRVTSTPVEDIDEPPEYDAPPNYDEALKLGSTPARRKTTNDGGLLNHLRMFRVNPLRHSAYDNHTEDPPPYEATPTHHNAEVPRRPQRRQLMRKRVSRSSTCPPTLSSSENVLSLSIPGVSQGSPHQEAQTSNGLALSISGNDLSDTITVSSISNSENLDIISIVTGKSIVSLGEETPAVEQQREQSEADSIIQRTKKLLFNKQASHPKQTQNQRRASIEVCRCEGACGCDVVLPVKVRKLAFEPKTDTPPSTYNLQELFKTFCQEPTKTEEKAESSNGNGNGLKDSTGVGQASHPVSLVQQAKERLFTSKKDSNIRVPPRPRFKMRRQKSEPPIFYIDIHSSEDSPTSPQLNEGSHDSTLHSKQNRNSFPKYGNESSTDSRGSWEIFQEIMTSAKKFIKPKVASDKEMNDPQSSLRKVSSDPTIAEQSTLMRYQSQQTVCSSLESFNLPVSPLLASRMSSNSPVSPLDYRYNFDSTCYLPAKTPSLENIPKTFSLQHAIRTPLMEPIPKTPSLEHISSTHSLNKNSETFSWEHIPKKFPMSSSLEQTPKPSSLENIPKTSSLDNSLMNSSLEHVPNTSSSGHVPMISSLNQIPIASSLECNPNASSLECNPNASSLECNPNTSSLECNPSASSLKCNPNATSLECNPNASSLECNPNTSSLTCIPQTCTPEHIPNNSLLNGDPTISSLEELPKISPLKGILKPPSSKGITRTYLHEFIPKISSSEGLLKTSLLENAPKIPSLESSPNTASIKVNPNPSILKDISKISSLEYIPKSSLSPCLPKTSSFKNVLKSTSLEGIPKTSSEDFSKSPSLEDIPKTSSMQDNQKTILLDDLSKISSLKDIPKSSSLEGSPRTSLLEGFTNRGSIEGISKTPSLETISRASSLECIPMRSSLSDIPNISSFENIPKASTSEDITETSSKKVPKPSELDVFPKTSSLEDFSKTSILENISDTLSKEKIPETSQEFFPKTSSLEDFPKTFASENISEIFSKEEILKSSSLEEYPKKCSLEDISKASLLEFFNRRHEKPL